MTVRPMLAAEVAQVQALGHQLWPDEPFHDFRAEHVFVWDRGNHGLGGFASVSIRPWVEGSDTKPCPHVEGWFVHADLRGRGVGRALIAAIEDWCREQGYAELTSDTGVDNSASLHAHSALGFEPTERIQYFRKQIGPQLSKIPVTVEPFHGARSQLLPLFMQADDSRKEIETYISLGEVLVARRAQRIIGHVQLLEAVADWEIKSVAVIEEQQRQGVGSVLMRAALDRAFAAAASRVLVATATADIDNLRFYQRLGFRMERVERDAFGLDRGYPPTEVDGIPVRDRVWFSISASDRPGGSRSGPPEM